MGPAHYAVNGAVAVISMDNPPVNGLGLELRSGLVAGLDRAAADDKVKAVVLIGTPRAFSGGADIREFNTPKMTAEPNLHNVIRTIEGMGKPVVAATDARAERARLENAGAQLFLEEPQPDGSLLIMLRDPWGVPLQLCQRTQPFPMP
jgi:3-hydroxyacyl-CoA dehydrogenase